MSAADCQVAVIGGGIAGAAACLRLLQKGLQPLWITAPCAVEDKPGEHLSPAARPLLAEIDALELLASTNHRAANSLFSAWGSAQLVEREGIVHLEGPSTVLNRRIFEQDLVAKVKAASGVNHIQMPLGQVQRNATAWHLLCKDQQTPYRANFVIDASGLHAIVGKQQSARFRADPLVAAIAYLTQAPNSNVEPTTATLIEAVRDGWWYAALLADGRLALNYYSDHDLLPANLSRKTAVLTQLVDKTQYISHWVADAEFSIQQPAQLASVGTTWIAPAAGEGWLAIGDAAAAFDPLSSHGMTTALWTAIQGADAAIAYLVGDSQPAHHYSVTVAQGVQDFLVASAAVYAQETRFREQPFWQRRITLTG